MPAYRRLASGKHQFTVRLPNGDRRSFSHKLKSVAKAWAEELERDTRRGDAVDPRAGQTTVAELWQRYGHGRRLEAASRDRDASHWRVHVEPHWGRWPAAAITRPDVTAWVTRMEQDEIGAWTIIAALGVLRALLDAAVDAQVLRANAAAGVRQPRPPDHLDRVLTPDEDAPLLATLDRVTDGRPAGRLMGELLLYCGLRWEEAAALDGAHVDRRLALLHIAPVVERSGRIRPYPKSSAGRRQVPVPDHLWPAVAKRAEEVGGGLLVPAPRGGVLGYASWRSRVWQVALSGRPGRPAVRGHAARVEIPGAGLADPQPTPHDLRHTFGTRLAEAGVPPHEIMALMGHNSLRSVQRYLHAGPDRFDRARAAMRVHGGRASGERQELLTPADTVDTVDRV